MINNLQKIESNISLKNIFNEIIFGKYDDGEMTNFICKSDKFPETYFIITESNHDDSITDFIKSNLTSQQSGIEQLLNIELPKKLSDKNINWEGNTFNISAIKLVVNNNSVEIKLLSLFEWFFSKMLFDNMMQHDDKLDLSNLMLDNIFNLYSLNFSDINNNYKELLNDENFKEIMENEKF